MYCKLFASLYQGTLRGRAHEILVFTNLLAHCDQEGYVDKHFKAIAEEVGLTREEVEKAITNLESPDPESRTPDLAGARLERMDPHRAWGWRVVNYSKYREMRHESDRREQNREAQRRHRAKVANQPPSAKVSRGQPQSSQVEVYTDTEVKEKNTSAGADDTPQFQLEGEPPPKEPSGYALFTTYWFEAYEDEWGRKYVFAVKDGATLRQALKKAFAKPDEMVRTAREAWDVKRTLGNFAPGYIKNSNTIHGLCTCYQQIRDFLDSEKTAVVTQQQQRKPAEKTLLEKEAEAQLRAARAFKV